jgi:glycosyltransferase involved in cell wall biosynthesis
MVGTIEPRKGHKQALDAFEKLWGNDQAVNLIIAGKQGWMSEEIAKKIKQHPQINKKLFWFNSASDETLLRLYDLADGVLIASEAEGFGLPLVEAAQHNCPILARDIPVFREIAGEHARYFPDDTTRDTLATALDQWLTELANHTAPRSSDMPYLTWAESTQQLLSLVFDKHSPRWLDHFSPIDRSIVT